MSTQTGVITKEQAEKGVEFTPFAGADPIKMTLTIVKNYIATPTRSGKVCSDRDAMRFMMLCRSRRLNPFEGDAFLIGFDGQEGPQFSLVTAHQAFLKRAENHPEFDGMESGVIVEDSDGKLVDRVSDFVLKDDKILGGWATVHFKNRKYSIIRRVNFSTFDTQRSRWKIDPAGMIVKVAESDALRSAFPTMLAGCYTQEETHVRLEASQAQVIDLPALPEGKPAKTQTQETRTPEAATGTADELAKPAQKGPGPQGEPTELEKIVTGAGFTFEDLLQWGGESGNIDDPTSIGSFDDIPGAIQKRLVLAKKGLLDGLKKLKVIVTP